MKKFIYILAAVCTLVLAGCQKDEAGEKSGIVITLSEKDFTSNGGTGTIHFRLAGSLTGPVRAESSKSWLRITAVTEDTVSYIVDLSTSTLDRTAMVTIFAGEEIAEITILQKGATFVLDGDESTVMLDPTGRKTVTLTYDMLSDQGDPEVVSEIPEWLDVDIKDGKVTFSATLNLTNETRTATVEISKGEWRPSVIYVVQEATSAFNYTLFGCDSKACTFDDIVFADVVVENEAVPSEWTIDKEGDWIDLDPGSVVSVPFSFSVGENTTGAEREGKIFLKDGQGRILSTTVVRQTNFSYDDMVGNYEFPSSSAHFVWKIAKDEERSYGLAAKIMGPSGTLKTEGYGLKLDYVASGNHGPKMIMKATQSLGQVISGDVVKNMEMYGILQGEYYTSEHCIVELQYAGKDGKVIFDFIAAEPVCDLCKGGIKGMSLTYYDNEAKRWVVENWILPDPDYAANLLYIKKLGGNHEGYTQGK